MARTEAGEALTERHRRVQLALRAKTIQDVVKLWPIWQLEDPDSYERLVSVLSTLVRSRSMESAALAAQYYQGFVIAEEIPMTAGRAAIMAEPPTVEEIRRAIDATGRAGVLRALGAGYTAEAASRNGLVRVSGAAGRLSMNGGRDTLINTALQDRQSYGWQRVTDGAP